MYVGVIVRLNEAKMIQDSDRLTEKYNFNEFIFIFVCNLSVSKRLKNAKIIV
jgi:hypothetical protein